MNGDTQEFTIESYPAEAMTEERVAELRDFFSRELIGYNQEDEPNFRVEGWERNPRSFLYQILKTDRFSEGNGEVFLARDINGALIATSAVGHSDFSEDIGVGGIRSWTTPKYRTGVLHRKHILPRQLDWCRRTGFSAMIMTLNDKNLRLFQAMRRKWAEFPGWEGTEAWPSKVYIQHTWQWVLITRLRPEFYFDFDRLGKYVNADR